MTERHKHDHEEENKTPADKQEAKTVTLAEGEYLELRAQEGHARECRERLLRMQADFENTRKRLEKEKQEFTKFANEGLILELLNVLDDLERTVSLAQAKHEDLPAFLKGVEMILAHLYEALKEQGVKPIEAAGKPFDPNYHEALMQVENSGLAEHTIVEELQKGYLLYERVIRTAKVKVSKRTEGRGQRTENGERRTEDGV